MNNLQQKYGYPVLNPMDVMFMNTAWVEDIEVPQETNTRGQEIIQDMHRRLFGENFDDRENSEASECDMFEYGRAIPEDVWEAGPREGNNILIALAITWRVSCADRPGFENLQAQFGDQAERFRKLYGQFLDMWTVDNPKLAAEQVTIIRSSV